MTTKLFLIIFYFTLFFLPDNGWAIDESIKTPSAHSAPVQASPAKNITQPQVQLDTPIKTTPVISAPPKITVTPIAQEPASKPATSTTISTAPSSIKMTPASAPTTTQTLRQPIPLSTAIKPASAVTAPPLIKTIPQRIVPNPQPLPTKAIPLSPPHIPKAPEKITSSSAPEAVPHTVDIEMFVRDNCVNCDNAKEFLKKLKTIQPHLSINIRNVRQEPAALDLLKRMNNNQGESTLDYPAFVIGGQLINGFTDEANTAETILKRLPFYQNVNESNIDKDSSCTSGLEPECGLIPIAQPQKTATSTINLLGYNISPAQIGLPIYTVAMGLLDGFNHGSTWVLILMISLLAPLKDRSLTFTIASTFIVAQAIIYYILVSIWFNLVTLIDVTKLTYFIFSGIALVAAFIYFKHYIQFGKTISITSPEIAKIGIYTRIRKIIQAQTMFSSIIGTIALAVIVQISEFSFSSIFPALYTEVLALQKLSTLSNYGYIALYDFSYMLDEIIILVVATITLNQAGSQNKVNRLLKISSAVVLLGTAIHLFLLGY